MSKDWITIDAALEEFHTTGEQLSKLIRQGDLELGPSVVSGGRELPQLSVAQLEEHFYRKDTHKARLRELSHMGVGAAVGAFAGELVGAFRSELEENVGSPVVRSRGRNRTDVRSASTANTQQLIRRLIEDWEAQAKFADPSSIGSIRNLRTILKRLSLSYIELADLANLDPEETRRLRKGGHIPWSRYTVTIGALNQRFKDVYGFDPMDGYRSNPF